MSADTVETLPVETQEVTAAKPAHAHKEPLSPGARVQKVSNIFENTRKELELHLVSEGMRTLVGKQLARAEATACRAVLQAK